MFRASARVTWMAAIGAAVAAVAACTAPPSETISGSPSATPSPGATLSESPLPSASPTSAFDYGLYPLDEPTSLWVVVNKLFPLNPETYEPPDLKTMPSIPRGSAITMRAEAAAALEKMHTDAVAVGAAFSISSAYRGYDFQAALYYPRARERGVAEADKTTARPGYSEHQTGLAVDIFDIDECRLRQCFGDRPAGKWVALHAWEYGFIVRYPQGMEGVTGYVWEPWHLRYVGLELSTEMHETGVSTLEEFFGLPPAPDYAESP